MFESQTRRIRQNSRPIAFASAVIAVGLIALVLEKAAGSTALRRKVGVPMSISLLHGTLSNKTDGV